MLLNLLIGVTDRVRLL